MISNIPSVWIINRATNHPFWLFLDAFQSATPFQGSDQRTAKINKGLDQGVPIIFEVFLFYLTPSTAYPSNLSKYFPNAFARLTTSSEYFSHACL